MRTLDGTRIVISEFMTGSTPRGPPASRTRSRGYTTVEQLLTTAAILSFFVYPISIAIRAVGIGLTSQIESAERQLLAQP